MLPSGRVMFIWSSRSRCSVTSFMTAASRASSTAVTLPKSIPSIAAANLTARPARARREHRERTRQVAARSFQSAGTREM
jgi:hypothetical protein